MFIKVSLLLGPYYFWFLLLLIGPGPGDNWSGFHRLDASPVVLQPLRELKASTGKIHH